MIWSSFNSRHRDNGCRLAVRNLLRKPLDGLDRARGAAPSQKFKFLVFQRIGGFKELLQLVDGACRKMAHVLQVALEWRAIGHRKDAIVAFFAFLGGLKHFEHSDRRATKHQAGIGRGIVDDENVDRIAVVGLGRGDEPPIVGIGQSGE